LIIRLCGLSAFTARWGTTITRHIKLDLNAPRMVAWRLLWIRLVELASEHDPNLYQELMGYPIDLPNLARLRPPGGNSRPAGVDASHFALFPEVKAWS
jgi:hypothetical protein